MFILSMDQKKKLASTPIIWMKTISNETGYYWPLYGLSFKLKNYVPLPIDSRLLKNEWRWVPCTVLLNGKQFKSLADAEKALSTLLTEKNKGKEDEAKLNSIELHEADVVESLIEVSSEAESVEQQSIEQESLEEKSMTESELNSNELNETGVEESVVEVVSSEAESVEQVSLEQKSIAESEANSIEVDEEKMLVVSREMRSLDMESIEQDSVHQESDDQESDEDVESFQNFPLNGVPNFTVNEVFLKNKNGSKQLMEFYAKINENSERNFFNRCMKLTFEDDFFIEKITFKKDAKKQQNKTDWIGLFHETRLYNCLKDAVVKKLKLQDWDDTNLKNLFVTNFERIRRAIKARG